MFIIPFSICILLDCFFSNREVVDRTQDIHLQINVGRCVLTPFLNGISLYENMETVMFCVFVFKNDWSKLAAEIASLPSLSTRKPNRFSSGCFLTAQLHS